VRISDIEDKSFDLVVVGGGVTGAGVFNDATGRGFKAILLEAHDFAWGASSRSSKMVHGGLRYLKQGKFFLTKTAVREREQLLKQYPGLVTPLDFIMPVYDHYGPSKAAMQIGLSVYSLLAGAKQHQSFSKEQTLELIPGVRRANLVSGVGFKDAQADDARLVLRLIHDGCLNGGQAFNYTKAESIERNRQGAVKAVNAVDTRTMARTELRTEAVINATGIFAENLHPSPVRGFHIRPLKGSHLVFPMEIFPLERVISFIHPQDQRPVFLFPWENTVILGTTDVDHHRNIDYEPSISEEEAGYLLEGLKYILPDLDISLNDCIASMAGIRPVLSKKRVKASRESREHVVWKDKGLITVTGGKLTTFRILAKDALKAARKYLPKHPEKKPYPDVGSPDSNDRAYDVSKNVKARLYGRYGHAVHQILQNYEKETFSEIENTSTLWAEIGHAAAYENVHTLADLLLRRVRIGLFLPQGGRALLDDIEKLCRPFLAWDKKRWEDEKKAYIKLWKTCYAPPGKRDETI